MSFQSDLKDGQKKELEFAQYLKDKYKYTHTAQVQGVCKDCDIVAKRANGHWESFEVKHDKKYDTTGNVAIELKYKDKSSGIMRSTSDNIIYVLGDEYWSASSSGLRKWLWMNEDKYKILNGGDGYASQLALIPLETFKTIFNKI